MIFVITKRRDKQDFFRHSRLRERQKCLTHTHKTDNKTIMPKNDDRIKTDGESGYKCATIEEEIDNLIIRRI